MCTLVLLILTHPSISFLLSVPVILAVPHSYTQPPLDPPTLGTLTCTFLPQIASHLHSVVLYTTTWTTWTDGSHSWLLNNAQTFLDSESKREWRMWTHERSRPQTDSHYPALCDWLEFSICFSGRMLLLNLCHCFCLPAPLWQYQIRDNDATENTSICCYPSFGKICQPVPKQSRWRTNT